MNRDARTDHVPEILDTGIMPYTFNFSLRVEAPESLALVCHQVPAYGPDMFDCIAIPFLPSLQPRNCNIANLILTRWRR